RADRRKEMEKQLRKIGWFAEFFPAIRPPDAGDFPSVGAYGCFIRHLEVLRKAEADGAGRLILLEDDVDFLPDFLSRWQFAMNGLQSLQWSIFYAGHSLRATRPGLVLLPHTKGVQCAHFM